MRVHDRAQELAEQAAQRLKDSDHQGEIDVGLVLMLFEAKDFGTATSDGTPPASTRRARQRVSRRRARV